MFRRSNPDFRRPISGWCRAGLSAAAVLAGMGVWSGASAQTLQETLAQTYRTNPQLEADRARQRSVDSDVARALGGYRPTASFSADGGRGRDAFQYDYLHPPQYINKEARTPRTTTVQVAESLYDGGRTNADVEHSELAVQQGVQQLRSVEQSVLGDAIQAYYDLYRDQVILDLTAKNVAWLKEQVSATQARFQVKDVTQTDVAQAEARLARGLADQTAAEGNVTSSRSNFTRASGLVPGKLPPPPPLPPAPATLDEALALAENNPDLQAANLAAKVARSDVDFVESGLLPTVSLSALDQRSYEASQRLVANQNQEVLVTLTVPLYEGGVSAARTRTAKHVAGQRRLETDLARRKTIDQVQRAWEGLTTARSRIASLNEQVRAAQIAVDSIKSEVRVGTRTVIDQLNAQQELLDAQTGLVRAQHDEAISVYGLLVSVGQLDVRTLGVPVKVYDPTEHYNEERGRWFGVGVDKDYDAQAK